MQEIPFDRISEMNRAKERITKREGFCNASFIFVGILAGGAVGTWVVHGEEMLWGILPLFPALALFIVAAMVLQIKDKALVQQIQEEVLDSIRSNNSD